MRATRLDDLRQQGVLLVAVGGWGCVLWLIIMAWLLDSQDLGWLLAIAVAVNILPSFTAWQRRFDARARMMAGTLAAVHPALGVYLLSGHPWQMDWHMFFFVAMASLTVLCDWRPIALAAILIAIHHVALNAFAADWVFSGRSEVGRVAIHALAVALQAGALAFVTMRMRDLLVDQGRAQAQSEELAQLATRRGDELQAAINRAEAAFADAERANAREAAERAHREQVERESFRVRRRDMLALANEFEGSVSGLAGQVADALERLGRFAQVLNTSAHRTTLATANVTGFVDQSSILAEDLARRVADLSSSVNAITSSVEAQNQSSSKAGDRAAVARQAVEDLQARTGQIGELAVAIEALARKTNLLAVNAAIEAARAGDAGRGFTVVAAEVKGLAGKAQQATGSVQNLARLSGAGAEATKAALLEILTLVQQFTEAERSIRDEISRQNDTAASIKEAARESATGVSAIVTEMHTITSVAQETAGLSADVTRALDDLSRVAAELRDQTGRFTLQLRAA